MVRQVRVLFWFLFLFLSVFFFIVTGKLTLKGGGDAGRKKFPDESAFGGVPN